MNTDPTPPTIAESGDAWRTGQCATLACLLEVSSPKPGNVHRTADFEDLTLTDFLVSAACIAPAMQAAEDRGVGNTVLDAIRATRNQTGRNTNLGTVLLLAPLAAVPRHVSLLSGVNTVLQTLTPDDARCVYEAIRIARPGGMGTVERMDIHDHPPTDLLEAMRAAADRDLVARQYVDGFSLVLRQVAPDLIEGRKQGWSLTESIVRAHVRLLSEHPDSLIARKCGQRVAGETAARAAAALDAGPPGDPAYHGALADLDFWMRSDGHRRNPGTTADLIAAGMFVALREGWLKPPLR